MSDDNKSDDQVLMDDIDSRLDVTKAKPFTKRRVDRIIARMRELGPVEEEWRMQWRLAYREPDGTERQQSVSVPIFDNLDEALKIAVRVFLRSGNYKGCILKKIQVTWTHDHDGQGNYPETVIDKDVPFPVYRNFVMHDWVRTLSGTHYKVLRPPYRQGDDPWRFAGHLSGEPSVIVNPRVSEVEKVNDMPFDLQGFMREHGPTYTGDGIMSPQTLVDNDE